MRGGWFGHQPVEATDLFVPHLRANGFEVDLHDSPKPYADAQYMAGVDLVVQCMTMSTIERDELAGLRAAVAAGTGMAGWHGGIADSYRNSSDYQQLIGALFACHPGKHPDERTGEQSDNYVPYRVNLLPAAADHPITQGLADFDLVTEQYWVLADSYIDVLATTTQAVPAVGRVAPAGDLAGDLDPAVGQGPDLRLHPGPSGRGAAGPDGAHPRRARHALGGARMSGPTRVGIVGAGTISAQYSATVAGLDQVVVTAVADLDPARAQALAATAPRRHGPHVGVAGGGGRRRRRPQPDPAGDACRGHPRRPGRRQARVQREAAGRND